MKNLVLIPEMALARAEGRKDVTRRISCAFKPGDVVYHGEILERGPAGTGRYRRDGTTAQDFSEPLPGKVLGWSWQVPVLPSRFCPERAARLFSMIRDVRTERLQAITEDDSRREGVCWGEKQAATINGAPGSVWFFQAREAFAYLWSALHPKEPWRSNPMVFRLDLGPKLTRDEARRLAEIDDVGERLAAGRKAA